MSQLTGDKFSEEDFFRRVVQGLSPEVRQETLSGLIERFSSPRISSHDRQVTLRCIAIIRELDRPS